MRSTNIYGFLAFVGAAAASATQTGICLLSPLKNLEYQTCASSNSAQKWAGHSTTSQPSWEGPENCVNGTCIFSNRGLGEGSVLLTTERNARIAGNFPTVAGPTVAVQPFHVVDVPGKGIGVIADRKIRKGEVILVQPPTLMVQTTPHVEMERGTLDALYSLAMKKLPRKGHELFMGQMGRDIYDKIEINCFQLYIDGENESGSHLGCYPEVSRINHDCRPNIHYRITNMTHTTVAARDILPGEELTISYIDLMLSREERRSRLWRWGFECSCSHCSMSDHEAAASDARLLRIEELEMALENFNETVVTAETGAELVELYEKERLDIYLGQVYTRAALNFALFGEEEKARKYALAAVEAVERESGQNASDAKAMRTLAENPRAHWTWGRRRKGKNTKGK
ncbi:SET domain-containing protein [Annulohypoxylon maeteangense]|uniref:SET domain-containing protein n=1 Tax=Annulohypoxylon maeteangense TaxID=1927788 RepID=UPI0020085C2D|nr:SET domain-containing protein [Annulohypoxylon maeteangense]KAI0886750.1 SET domain-containing protein [Annulohypoxylon maeteangense]